MIMKPFRRNILFPLLIAGATSICSFAQAPFPAAIFPFEERGVEIKGYGGKVSDVIFASLAASPDLFLVDRNEIAKVMAEQELALSGAVNPADAVRIGQIIGARILITGSISEVDKTVYVVAKVIGTETTRVLGESIKGHLSDPVGPMAEQLAEKIAKTINEKGDVLVAKPVTKEDRIANLREKLGEAQRPRVTVTIPERHIGQPSYDPAAETEFALYCREAGFDVLDSGRGDVEISGEGFSEFAMRRGNLVSVKARVEVKAVDVATGKILAVDSQHTVAVDLSEQIAGKTALQQASAMLAERILPKLAGK